MGCIACETLIANLAVNIDICQHLLRITNRDWKFEEFGQSNFDRIIQGCALAMQQSRSPLRVEQMGPSGFQPEACWRVVSRRVGELVQIQQTQLAQRCTLL